MNSVVDAYTKRTPHIVRDLIEKVLGTAVSRVQVFYGGPSPTTFNATAGTATSSGSGGSVFAWKGVPVENEEPGPDTAALQYIVLREDMDGFGLTPARGHYITDSTVKYSIDKVEEGRIGGDVVYYLFHCSLRSP